MKKLFTLLLAALSVVGYAQQIKTITPHGDTVKFTPAIYNPATFTTTPTSALFQQGNFTQAVVSISGGGTVTPPVNPPPPPPSNGKRFKYKYSAAISLRSQHDITISGDSITTDGGILLVGCWNVHITKNYLANNGAASIHLSNCYNVTIDSNYAAQSARLVYAESCPQGGIVVINNQGFNPLGPVSASGAGQFCQFDGVGTVSVQNIIANNLIETLIGNTGGEDKINLYKSNGTQALPILVNGNKILNGSSSKTGGGIMMGDNGGNWQSASNNVLVNPGQYGMAIAGGSNNTISNNQVFSAKFSYSNVGIYVWGQGSTVSNATVSGNKVTWTNSAGSANPDWLGTGESTPAGWSGNTWSAGLTPAILPASLMTWR